MAGTVLGLSLALACGCGGGTTMGSGDVWGSIFARDFLSPGYARIFHDRAIQCVPLIL